MGVFGLLLRIWGLVKSIGNMLGSFGTWVAAGLGFQIAKSTTDTASKGVRVILFVAASITAFGLLLVALYSGLSAVAVTLPGDVIQTAGYIFPSNTMPCVTVLVSARIARFFYDWQTSIASKLLD